MPLPPLSPLPAFTKIIFEGMVCSCLGAFDDFVVIKDPNSRTLKRVLIQNGYLTPKELKIRTGQTVQWLNAEGKHKIILANGLFKCADDCSVGYEDNMEASSAHWTLSVTFHKGGKLNTRPTPYSLASACCPLPRINSLTLVVLCTLFSTHCRFCFAFLSLSLSRCSALSSTVFRILTNLNLFQQFVGNKLLMLGVYAYSCEEHTSAEVKKIEGVVIVDDFTSIGKPTTHTHTHTHTQTHTTL